ncbi:hypothetical protein MBLNU457_5351t1 [Dothideomycetes sp. NU457]
MSAPLPPQPLDGHCSAIDNNILYVFSSDSFQSLPLKENATWSSLPMGQAVNGPSCLRAVPNGDESQAAMYVIGGTSSNSGYQGLQRYTFSTQKWESLTPTSLDMQDRTDHSVAYLNDTQSILVYAGSRPDSYSELSSQTFVISTQSPYLVRSFTSTAPPANSPILLPWTSDTAIMVGGSTTNRQVWTFDPNNGGWNQTQTTLSATLRPTVKGTIVTGSDGSKVLEAYDMTVSPNVVSQFVLLGAGGSTSGTGQAIDTSAKNKRDLNLSDWPPYNSTNAPTATRSDYAVAQGSNGMTVMSGGNAGVPINIFSEDENEWIDNGLFFQGKSNQNHNQIPLVTPTTKPSATALPTSSSSATPTGATLLDNESSRHHMLRVLGITLGVLCGIAALFIIALLVLRYRKQKKRRQTTYINEKGDRMSFQDRGASFMKEAGVSAVDLSRIPPNHRFMEQNSSHSSFAIMAGKFGKRNSKNVSPKMNNANRGSTESTRHLVKPKKSDISKPVELDLWGADKEAVVAQRAVDSPRLTDEQPQPQRSSGWSRYFAPHDSQLPAAYAENMPNVPASIPQSYNESRERISSDVFVPPLDFTRGNDKERISRVATGSPAFNNSAEDLARRGSSLEAARGQRAQISGSRLAHNDDDNESGDGDFSQTNSTRTYSTASDRYSSSTYNHDSSSASAWTPVSQGHNHEIKPIIIQPSALSPNLTHAPRPPSSNYTNSVYDTKSRVFSRGNGNSGFFLSGKQEFARPNSRKSPTPGFLQPSSSAENILSNGGIKNGLDVPVRPEDRESTMTVFPRGVPSAYYADRNAYEQQHVAGMDAEARSAKPVSDMSWLRLDEGNRI